MEPERPNVERSGGPLLIRLIRGVHALVCSAVDRTAIFGSRAALNFADRGSHDDDFWFCVHFDSPPFRTGVRLTANG
jgi:hypothetical protein